MSRITGRILLILCLATASWSFSFGLGTQVITHWLKARAASDTVIGLTQSVYYLGIALAALLVPWLTRRLGSTCAPIGMMLSGLTLALFPLDGGQVGWFILRLCNGMAGAMSLIPLETLVSRDSSPNKRTRNFSYYAVALTLGGALGIWAGLHFFGPDDAVPFFLGGLLPLIAGIFLYRALPPPGPETSPEAGTDKLERNQRFLSYATAWYQGFLEGGMLTFLSLYLMALGLSKDSAGAIMSATLVGVIVFQVPVAWLADRLGRLPVLLACYGVVALGLALTPFLAPSPGLVICLFFLGACSGALYPLALAFLGDRLAPGGLTRAYSWFMAMECVGSQLGATVMGRARDWWGEAALFGVGLAALVLVIGAWAVLQIRQRCWAWAKADLNADRRAA